ncbi:MAG: hypothetical protein JSV09_09455 [Thermoplasmata archaeon]|nr:MAG: hypothetical protein JSV09_09455 [Thermoplasmata archaeon]
MTILDRVETNRLLIALIVWAIAFVVLGILAVLSPSFNAFLNEKVFNFHIGVIIVLVMMVIGLVNYRVLGKKEIYE